MRRQRRSRYTVTFTNGETQVLLALNAQHVRDHYGDDKVAKVVKGDFRPRDSFSTTRWRPTRGGYTWRWDRPAIAAAFEALTGFPLPADLVLTSDPRGVRTRGWFNYSGGRPTIKVRTDLTLQQANRTLWHELAHLAQFVRAGSPEQWAIEYKRERKQRHGYVARPCEREAREWEALAATDMLLKPR